METLDIRHDVERRHFETTVDGHVCEVVYRVANAVMTIVHTGVPVPVEGRGIAAQLMRFALETARSNGWQVVPACEYAAAFMQRHPEFDDLRRH